MGYSETAEAKSLSGGTPEALLSAMYILRLALGALLVWLLPGPAFAQHAAGSQAAPGGPDGCTLCHGTHEAGGSASALTQDPAVSAELGGNRIGSSSLSCLRCHSTRAARLRQPGFRSGGASSLAGGLFLGSYLEDDHPLGQMALTRPEQWNRAPRDLWDGTGSVQLPGSATSTAESVTCATCHDPHARVQTTPSPEDENWLCTGCHDPAVYAFENHETVPCTGCHRMHGGDSMDLLTEPSEEQVCRSCHGTTAASPPPPSDRAQERQYQIRLSLSPPTTGHLVVPQGRCTDCHAQHRR